MKLQTAIGCGAAKNRGFLSESFVGSDAASWSTSNWVTEHTGTSGGATILSNAGKMSSGTAGGYAGATRTTRSANITSPTDADISGSWTPDTNEPYGYAYLRATVIDASGDVTTGYLLYMNTSGTLQLQKAVSSVYTTLGSNITFSASGNTTYGFRMRVVGTTIQGRIWSGATEPSSWDVNVTDSGVSAAGKAGLSVRCGSAAVAHSITFDNIRVTI